MKLREEAASLAAIHFPLTKHIAQRYLWTGIELDDLIGICGEALCRAAELFDGTRGYKFSTYAGKAMHLRILKTYSRSCSVHTTLIVNHRITGREDAGMEMVELREAMSKMDSRRLRIRMLYYVHGYTQMEIAKVYGVSQVQISRLIKPKRDERKGVVLT